MIRGAAGARRLHAERLHPDVVLIDVSLTARGCIASLRSMKEPTRVVVLGSYREAALGALTAGASDYVLKDAGRNRLLEAIRRVVPADSALGASGFRHQMRWSA